MELLNLTKYEGYTGPLDLEALLAEDAALRKTLDYYKRLHILRKKAKLALNLRIRDLRDQLRDEKAKSKDYEHNWHLTCSEVKELRKENERLTAENAEWKRAHDEHDCTATVDVGGEIERLKKKLEKAIEEIKTARPLMVRAFRMLLRWHKDFGNRRTDDDEQSLLLDQMEGAMTGPHAAIDSARDTPFDKLMDNIVESRKELEKGDSICSEPLNTGEGIPQVRIVEEKDAR